MYSYNDRSRYNGRRRRGRGWYGFPWLIFVFIWVAPHIWWVFLVMIPIAFFIIYLIRSNGNGPWNWNQQQNNVPYQLPYYQPQQPSRNESGMQEQEPYYRPYEQGYQAQQQQSERSDAAYQAERNARMEEQDQSVSYESYDQPRAEYPQQMPPM